MQRAWRASESVLIFHPGLTKLLFTVHEFSLCRRIINIVENAVARTPEQVVHKVVLCIGELAGVDIASLKFWFPVAARNSRLQEAALEILHEKAEALCTNCHCQYVLVRYDACCPNCQSFEKEILSGQEMQVKNIEVI